MALYEQFLFDNIVSSTNSITQTFDQTQTEPLCDIRLKVDRKVLDVMLNGGDINTESAEVFFIKISSETGAIISYPQKLQMGTKCKRDPQIRIIGSAHQIEKARNKILESMDPHRNKVTLKLDVSHTDHSHIIGRGGKQIQAVMDLTECHIHFPDCNRSNTQEKSNQVTIAGTSFWSVEQARQLIRQHLPLIISFQIGINGAQVNLLDISHPNLQYIQKKNNVIITFRWAQRNPHSSASMATVFIKGSRTQFEQLKEATRSLYQYLNGSYIGFNNMVITIAIDIASQHHSFVMGRGNSNVKSINDHTGAVVTFPELAIGSPQLQKTQTQNRKSLVTIKGRGIESAFMAWLELLGYLPLVLVFDLKPNQPIDGKLIAELMANQQISLLIRPKNRNGNQSILIKSHEKNSRLLFEARKRILQIHETDVYLPAIQSVSSVQSMSASSLSGRSLLPSGFPQFPLLSDLNEIKPETFRQLFESFENILF